MFALIKDNKILEIKSTTFPVHPDFVWVSYDEASFPMTMATCRDYKYDGTNFSDPDPWVEFPGISLADAKTKKKSDLEKSIKVHFRDHVDDLYAQHYRETVRGDTPTAPDETTTVFEDALKADWNLIKTTINAFTTVKEVADYMPSITQP